MSKARVYLCVLVSLLLLAVAGTAALAQGPEAFGLSARFGSAVPTTTRQLAMGAPEGCLDDEQFGNPGFAAIHSTADAAVRWISTNFDRGPEVTSLGLNYVQPWHRGRDGFQLTILSLSSSGGQNQTLLPGPMTATADLSEEAFTVDYGRRFGRKVTAGLSILGTDHVGFNLTSGLGTLVDVTANALYGARVGGTYEWFPGDYAGLTYSFAQHSVHSTTRNQFFQPQQNHTNYRDDLLTAGLGRHVTPELLLALEFHHGSISGAGVNETTNAWHAGAEYALSPQWAVRAGDADGATTLGAGWKKGPWRADYAYLKDWNASSTFQLLGGSTTHSLQAGYSW